MVKSFFKLAGLLSVLVAVFLLSPLNSARAATGDNIRGWADSSRGYISFNCLDDGFAGHFPFTFTFPFNIAPCANNQHGVNLDANNNFSGQAWNQTLGFITFTSASSTPDGGLFRGNCEVSVATSTACYRESDGQVYGYMQVESTGEWIRLDDPLVPPSTRITNYLSASQPGIFSGYASSSFGSIKFNCKDDDVCITNSYEVRIGPIEIRQMTAPNWNSTLACGSGAKQAMLSWNRRSGVQSAYEVIVSTQNSTSSGWILDSGKIMTDAGQYSFTPPSYDTPYYWFLRLWDASDVPTPWRQFNTSGTKDWISDNFARNTAKSANPNLTFTTYKHEFPRPAFTWSPEEIVVATTTNSFVSSSYYYNDSNTLQPCSGTVCDFTWTTSDALATILSANSASTSIMFTKATNTVVTLTSSDDDIYTCSTSTILGVNYALPLWKEIKAP